jgi:hypothetical protein
MGIAQMETKKCNKCNKVKLISEFYLSNSKKKYFRSDCKECNIIQTTDRRENNKTGYWYVYKIIEDNYVGITSDFNSRKATHKYLGKVTSTMKIIARYKKPEYALIHEAIMHLLGYKGCSLKPKGQ